MRSCYTVYMPREKQDLKQKVVKITPQLQDMLDTFTEKWGFISESEVIRQAILFYYRKMEPEYLKPSPRQQKEIDEARAKKEVEDMTPEDYAKHIMKARLFTTPDGKKVAVTMTIANTIKIWNLDTIKETDAQDSFFRETHLKMLSEGVDFDVYLNRSSHKLKALGIDIETKNKNENQSGWNNNETTQESKGDSS